MEITKKKSLLKRIKEVLTQHDYNFRNREDFVESRFSWDELAQTANDFYYIILETKDILTESDAQIEITDKLANDNFKAGKELQLITFCVIGNIHHMGNSDSHISASIIVKKDSEKYKKLMETDDYKVFTEYTTYYYA